MADFSKWAQKHLSRVGEDFEEVDKDKSGSLDFFEVYNVLQKSGFKGTLEEAKVRRIWFITTPSKIFPEFVYIPCKFFNLLNADFQYLFFLIIFQRIFQSLDVDKNEKISKDEYVKSMAKVPKIDFKWV